jgi:hypothetical protein
MILPIVICALVIYALYRMQNPRNWQLIRDFNGPPLMPIFGIFWQFHKCRNMTGRRIGGMSAKVNL